MTQERFEYLENLEKTDFKAYLETSLSSTEHIEYIVMQYEKKLQDQKDVYESKVFDLESNLKQYKFLLHEKNKKILELIGDIQHTLIML